MPARNAATDALARPVTLSEAWAQLPADSNAWVPGQRLGPYRLQRQLGKGGMGVVWLAEQLTPLQREVAIKLLPPDPDNPLTEIYFEVERQALAQLSHRSIAQIYDAGRLPDGALFFAMEYVAGAPLDAFLMAHPLPLPAIVRLLVQICHGAHHAHQRALIHRDLKPLNILVQMVDGEALPKIIDFGLALGTLPGSAARLEAGKAVGTPGYMSPEQKMPSPAGIDARSDVYALGAILGQCLCWQAGVIEAGRAVDSATLHEGLQRSLAKAGGAGPAEFSIDKLKAVPQDLRAIAVQALAQDREQRYDSAAAMADDLTNWLHKRPVRAMGSSRWYAVRCFVKRHRLVTAAATAIVLALLAGVLMAMHGMRQAREAQALAEQRRDDAERLIQFMLGDFADKLRPIGRLDLLESIGAQALTYLAAPDAGRNADSALRRARALRTLGEVQVTRQQFEAATATLTGAAELLEPWADEQTAARADWHFESGQVAFWLGMTAYRQREWDRTERHWLQYLRDAQAYAQLGGESDKAQTELASAYNNLGTLAEARDQLTEALGFFRQAAAINSRLARDPADPASIDLANAHSWISRVQLALGQPGEAWRNASEALRLVVAQRTPGADNARRRQLEINFRYLLALQALHLGAQSQAIAQLRNALDLAEEDIANDPSQPRRQAYLARIAFLLARIDGIPVPEASVTLQRGEQALAMATIGELDAHQQTALPAQANLARAAVAGPGANRLAQLQASLGDLQQALAASHEFDVNYLTLLELAVETATALARADAPPAVPVLAELQRRIDAMPAARRQNLRCLLVQNALWQLQPDASADAGALQQRIQQFRGESPIKEAIP